MSDLNRDQLKHLAVLSRLHLSDSEIDGLLNDLKEILRYVEKLQKVKTEGVEPTAQVTGLVNVMREDVEYDYGVSRNDLLQNAPAQKDGFIKVRRVIL